MKDMTEHLGVLALGYLWNHPLQQLNDLLGARHPDAMDPVLTSALRKLTVEERRALKRAITAIFAKDMTDFCTALDDNAHRWQERDSAEHAPRNRHTPPWEYRMSYFDREGDPKAEFIH